MGSAYLLDADVFITAKRDHYAMSFCPAFWDWLLDRRAANRIFSTEAIFSDLCRHSPEGQEEDELTTWVKGVGETIFLPHDQEMADKCTEVATWAYNQNYPPAAVTEFLGCSDYFLISYALAHGYTVVTHEKSKNSTKRIKIPDACKLLQITCVSPFQMIRDEGARFVLETTNGTPKS